MNYQGLTGEEIQLFKDLLKKANNMQIPQLTSMASNEYKDRMMRGF